jgi:hypothetical protein
MAEWGKFSKEIQSGTKNQYSKQDIEAMFGNKPIDSVPFMDLFSLRNSPQFAKDIPFQNAIAPYEHAAYTRGIVGDSESKLGAVGNAVIAGLSTPIYSAAKVASNVAKEVDPRLQFMQSRSQPTLDQLSKGFEGIGRGLDRVKSSNLPVFPPASAFKEIATNVLDFYSPNK